MVLSVAVLSVLLSLLAPVDAHPSAYVRTIEATAFVYLPHVVKESTPTPHPIPGVDLRIWDIVNSPEVPVIGQTITFRVSVINQGRDEAPSTTLLRLSVDGEQVGIPELIPPLKPGQIEERSWGKSSSILGAGEHTMEAEADLDDVVAEINEDNNTLRDTFQIVSSSQ